MLGRGELIHVNVKIGPVDCAESLSKTRESKSGSGAKWISHFVSAEMTVSVVFYENCLDPGCEFPYFMKMLWKAKVIHGNYCAGSGRQFCYSRTQSSVDIVKGCCGAEVVNRSKDIATDKRR